MARRSGSGSSSGSGDRKAGAGTSGKPGLLNKSMIAFTTIADGIAVSGKHLLSSSGEAATAMVGHRYGDDARRVAHELTRSVTNVGLVYIDVTGVSRRAVLRSVAKGMLVGRVRGGGQVLVGDGDGGVVPADVADKAPRPSSDGKDEPPSYTPGDYKPGDYRPDDYKTPPGGSK
jgi:spartin